MSGLNRSCLLAVLDRSATNMSINRVRQQVRALITIIIINRQFLICHPTPHLLHSGVFVYIVYIGFSQVGLF